MDIPPLPTYASRDGRRRPGEPSLPPDADWRYWIAMEPLASSSSFFLVFSACRKKGGREP